MVLAAGINALDAVLATESLGLDEVVVTGTAGASRRREVGQPGQPGRPASGQSTQPREPAPQSKVVAGSAADGIALLDLDSLVPQHTPTWRHRVRALGQLEAYAIDLYPELPRTDRARVLRAYFEREPSLRARRRALVRDVRAWVERRLASWKGRDRALHIYYPLAPRAPLAATVVDVRSARCE